jgi:hypothetical protein
MLYSNGVNRHIDLAKGGAMKRVVSVIFLLVLLISFSAFSQENLTITTYYPAPFGVYNELRSKRIAIGQNYFDNSVYPWDIDNNVSNNEIPQDVSLVIEGRVGIGTVTPRSILDLTSIDSGLLPPRMTEVQRDVINSTVADAGMMIYNTTVDQMEFYDGTDWVTIGTQAITVTESIVPSNGPAFKRQGYWCGTAPACPVGPPYVPGCGDKCMPGAKIFDLGKHTFCALSGFTGPGGFNVSCLVYYNDVTETWKMSVFDADANMQTQHCMPTCLDIDSDGSTITHTAF